MSNVLFIRVDDNGTIEHPILEENLREVFPDLDVNNPPSGFARFERVEVPAFEDFRVVYKTTYELSEQLTSQYGTPTYTDVYHIREMTEEEKAGKTQCPTTYGMDIDTPVYNVLDDEPATQQLEVPEKPEGDYTWDPYTNTWVNVDDLRNIFGPFFRENKLSSQNFSIDNLSDEKKQEFIDLIEAYKASRG